MVDLKEFLDKEPTMATYKNLGSVSIEKLGLFFWERGGKQYVLNCKNLKFDVWEKANYKVIGAFYQQSFLDCLACLGEVKVKELIDNTNIVCVSRKTNEFCSEGLK